MGRVSELERHVKAAIEDLKRVLEIARQLSVTELQAVGKFRCGALWLEMERILDLVVKSRAAMRILVEQVVDLGE